jgi:hypothetical protein
LSTVSTSFKKSSDQKNSKRKRSRGKCKLGAEICQNRTIGKDRFFQKSSVAQIEKCKTNES